MGWIDDLGQELQFKDQERSQKDALQYQRLLGLQEQGPLFFKDLKQQLRSAAAHSAFKDILFGDLAERSLSVRNSESRPIVKVTAHLSTTCIIIVVEACSSAAVPYVETANHRIEFGLDVNGKLSMCMECIPITLEDIAKLILRHAVGLA
jgi:hypothetical protein